MPVFRTNTTLPRLSGGNVQTTYDEAGQDAALARGLRHFQSVGLSDIYVPASLLNRDAPRTPPQIPDNLSGAGATVPIVMGFQRVVAQPYFIQQSGAAYFDILYIVCEGEINSYQTMFVDGVEVDVSGQTPGTGFAVSGLDTAAWCNLFTGTSGQDVGAGISTYVPTYTDTNANFAIMFIRLPAAVVQRAPRIEFIVEGKKIKDYTNSGVVGYTNNLGNILIHWIEIVEGRTIDTTSATTLANACAEDVGNGTSRRVGGITISTGSDTTNMRQVLRAHAAAHVLDTGGSVYFIPDRPADSVMDIGPSQLIGDVSIQGPSLRNKPEDVVIHWYNPLTGSQETARATDTVSGAISEVRMPGITTAAQAKREVTERYNHLTLEGDTVQFTMGPRGVELEPGDVVRLTDPRVGLADKPYRLLRADIPQLGLWRWTAKEYQPNVYSDEVQGDPEIGDTDLDNPLTVPSVAGLSLTAQNKVSASGVDNQVKIEWTAPTFAFVAFFLIEVYNNDNSPATLEQTIVAPNDATSATAAGLIGGTDYEIKIRIQSTAGKLGAFASGFETTYHDTIVSLYEFESGARTTDSIGFQSLSEISASDISDVTGKVGSNAAELDCTTNRPGFQILNVGASAIQPPWTMGGWFRLTTAPTSSPSPFFLWGQAPSGGGLAVFLLYVDNNRDIYLQYDNLTSLTNTDTTKTMTLNTWHYLSLQYHEGGFIFVFDDNEPVLIQSGMLRTRQDQSLFIGNGLDGIGEVDQFRIHRSALNGEEIEAIRADEA